MGLGTLSEAGKGLAWRRAQACFAAGTQSLVVLLVLGLGLTPCVRAEEAPALSVPMLVAGILKFTQWPAPAHIVKLCVVGNGSSARELLTTPLGGVSSETVAIDPQQGAVVRAQCDAVFVDLPGRSARLLLSELVEHPILTMGEGPAFCSDGGMFCVDTQQSPLRFGTNLDAISRSGLRVNPQVLFLARRKSGAAP